MRKDHIGVQAPDRRRFSSLDDALHRLLPYHVFQGAPPSQEEFFQGNGREIGTRVCGGGGEEALSVCVLPPQWMKSSKTWPRRC